LIAITLRQLNLILLEVTGVADLEQAKLNEMKMKFGGPGGIWTRDLPDVRPCWLANRTFFGP
jgi:hypothetical protein